VLTAEDTEKICSVVKGSPMGEVMRRYWIPFLLTTDIPDPDGEPVRVELLGEPLVAFRNTSGVVGLVSKFCAHRCADLWHGRNEENGLRCTYHGWKYDVGGNCVEMPSEPGVSNFASKIKLTAYPVREVGGVLFTHMGSADQPAELPVYEWMKAPEGYVHVSWNFQECNFVQAIEGGIDTVHGVYLHSSLDSHSNLLAWRGRAAEDRNMRYRTRDNAPKLYTQDSDFGVIVAGKFEGDQQEDYWRMNFFYDPFSTSTAGGGFHSQSRTLHHFVPINDHVTARWSITYKLDKPYTARELGAMRQGRLGVHSETYPGTHWPTHNAGNNYQVDREMQRTESFTGIKDFGAQDYSVQEGMGAIQDRTIEHLGTSDVGIIAMRRRLLKLATELLEGVEPYSATHGEAFHVHASDMLLQPGVSSWFDDPVTQEAIAPIWR
jgi:phthalate 4,5-dioxygenase oxygenase subunit